MVSVVKDPGHLDQKIEDVYFRQYNGAFEGYLSNNSYAESELYILVESYTNDENDIIEYMIRAEYTER